MANAPSRIDLQNESLTQFLAKAVSDGTLSDVVITTKEDNPGEEAAASQIQFAAGELWANVVDDFVRAMYGVGYRANKLWGVDDGTERNALGSDHGLVVEDLAWMRDLHQFWYCVSVDGPTSSSWASATGGGGADGPVGWRFAYDTGTADADPGAGEFRFNNADPDAATFIYLNNNTVDGIGLDRLFLDVKQADRLFIQQHSDPTRGKLFRVNGTVTSGGAYLKIPVFIEPASQGADFDAGENCTLSLNYIAAGLTAILDKSNNTGGKNIVMFGDALISGTSGTPVTAQTPDSDVEPVLRMETTGTNGSVVNVHTGDRTPVGNVVGEPSDLYVRKGGTSSRLYQHQGASANNTGWVEIGAGGGGGSLAATLAIGNTTGGIDISLSGGSQLYSVGDLTITSTGNSADVYINAAQGVSAEGGDITLQAGGSTVSGSGGDVWLEGGVGETEGGRVVLQGGACGGIGPGGNIEIAAGESTTDEGGFATLAGGVGVVRGGSAVLRAGQGENEGGNAFVIAGDCTVVGAGGDTTISAGDANVTGRGGKVMLAAGDGDGGVGGDITVTAGDGDTRGGDFLVFAGDCSNSGRGGDAIIQAGAPLGTNRAGGNVIVSPRAATGTGAEGSAYVNGSSIITRCEDFGAVGAGLYHSKKGPDVDGDTLYLKRLTEGPGITLTINPNDIEVAVSGGGGGDTHRMWIRHMWALGGTGKVYIPMDSADINESSSITNEVVRTILPGRFRLIQIKLWASGLLNSTTMGLHVNNNATPVSSVVVNVAAGDTGYTFDFEGDPLAITENNQFTAISFDPGAAAVTQRAWSLWEEVPAA